MILYITFVKKCLTVSFWLDCSTVACLSLCMCVCLRACSPVCVRACQFFIVDECVMFFTALCPRLTVHLLRSGREVVLSFSQRRRRGRQTREVLKEKEWPSADSRLLCRSKVFSQWQPTGGKTNQTFLRYRTEEKTELSTKPQFLSGM